MNPLQILFSALLGIAAIGTVVGYPRKYGALSGRSRLFRTLGVGMIDLLLILAVVATGTDWDAIPDRRVAAARGIIYLMLLTFLLLSLVAVAALDALENVVIYRRERREVLQQIIRDEIESQTRKRMEKEKEGVA